MTVAAPVVEIRNLGAGYGRRQVLSGLDLVIGEREIFLLLGHNGAGKTTLLRSIFGLLKPAAGSVHFLGSDITGQDPRSNVGRGIAFVPQGHAIFRRLTVRENLMLGGFIEPDKAKLVSRIEAIHHLFPILAERKDQIAGTMSGGQQQMLAVGMALMLAPKLMILDEPSIGLAPNLVSSVMESIVRVRDTLGATILIVEQNVEKSLPIASRAMIMRTGRSVYCGRPEPLFERATLIKYF